LKSIEKLQNIKLEKIIFLDMDEESSLEEGEIQNSSSSLGKYLVSIRIKNSFQWPVLKLWDNSFKKGKSQKRNQYGSITMYLIFFSES
jgi:hypothetical protein